MTFRLHDKVVVFIGDDIVSGKIVRINTNNDPLQRKHYVRLDTGVELPILESNMRVDNE